MNEINEKISILVVDDEPLIRESLYEIFRIEGYEAQMAPSAEEAIELIEENPPDIVISDLQLPKMTGLDLLKEAKQINPETEFILITGYGSIETAVEAMKSGAYDYITKPINDNEIKLIIDKIKEKKAILFENKRLKEIIAKDHRESFCGMIGSSEKMQQVYHTIECVANANATILITGESGIGKNMIAKAIHETDVKRKGKPFVEISCGALSETLLESELFGHVKGSFTGAIKDKEGRFEYANDGTIFLDEIDTLSLTLQVKLLRVLQDREFERVGDNTTRKTNARIIVATNQNLPGLIKNGDFREDLYYRVNVIAIQPPPLREREGDVDPLIDFYVERYAEINNKDIKGLSDEVRKMFNEYHWPGNIRELQNAIEGAVIMSQGEYVEKKDLRSLSKFTASSEEKSPKIELSDLQIQEDEDKNKDGEEPLSLKEAVEEPEKVHILNVLEECHWNRLKAAEKLGINRTTLYNKMKKYNIKGK